MTSFVYVRASSRPPCLFSHHTCSGALKYGLQEWLPSTFYDDLIAPCVRKKVWKILGRECKPVRYLARFLETYPLFYDERCHWDLGLWILTKHGLRSEKHWNLWSLWKRFQEQSGMTDFRILCFSGKCNTRLALWLYFWSVLAEFWLLWWQHFATILFVVQLTAYYIVVWIWYIKPIDKSKSYTATKRHEKSGNFQNAAYYHFNMVPNVIIAITLYVLSDGGKAFKSHCHWWFNKIVWSKVS